MYVGRARDKQLGHTRQGGVGGEEGGEEEDTPVRRSGPGGPDYVTRFRPKNVLSTRCRPPTYRFGGRKRLLHVLGPRPYSPDLLVPISTPPGNPPARHPTKANVAAVKAKICARAQLPSMRIIHHPRLVDPPGLRIMEQDVQTCHAVMHGTSEDSEKCRVVLCRL